MKLGHRIKETAESITRMEFSDYLENIASTQSANVDVQHVATRAKRAFVDTWDEYEPIPHFVGAKRERLYLMSELYHTLREAVFVALETRERKEKIELAKSLDLAKRHPLKWHDERVATPELTPENSTFGHDFDDVTSTKATPTQSFMKQQACFLPDLSLCRQEEATNFRK